MPYILNTSAQIKEMLNELGLSSLDELYGHLPQEVRTGNPDIASGLSEAEVKSYIESLAKQNSSIENFNSFLGAGIYDHYIPSALNHILYRTEFYTPYTPYQPECSQGVLQAIYEYQTFICLLTGMDVSNASLYDGASSLSEAVLMALRITKRNKVIVSETTHPEYRKTVRTYLSGVDCSINEVGFCPDGLIDFDFLKKEIDEDTACIVVQSPNFFGLIEDLEEIGRFAKAKGAVFVLTANPMSLSILKQPADLGVDIVCGDGQPFGGGMNFGGPTFGFLATKEKYTRQIPGRIAGKTKDADGAFAFCLTLQTREQHIRRQRATSNICSNQSLNAVGAAIYLSLMGKDGLQNVALRSTAMAHYLYSKLKQTHKVKLPFGERFFNEFVWQIEPSAGILAKLKQNKIIAGLALDNFYPNLKNHILSACTEKKSKDDIDKFVENLINP